MSADEKWLQKFNERYGISITRQDIIRPADKAIGTDGSIAILRGNLAPEGAVINTPHARRRCSRQFSRRDRLTARKSVWMLS